MRGRPLMWPPRGTEQPNRDGLLKAIGFDGARSSFRSPRVLRGPLLGNSPLVLISDFKRELHAQGRRQTTVCLSILFIY